MITAEHEEKPDEYGHIYRRITRNYLLPRDADCDKLNATFSDNGTLVICAQKKAIEAVTSQMRLTILKNSYFNVFYFHCELGNERKIEIKKVTSQPQQVSQKTKQQETGKAKGTSIPVTHETGKA